MNTLELTNEEMEIASLGVAMLGAILLDARTTSLEERARVGRLFADALRAGRGPAFLSLCHKLRAQCKALGLG